MAKSKREEDALRASAARDFGAIGAPIRISLSEDDFLHLCCGRTLSLKGNVKLGLQDIGLETILAINGKILAGTANPSCDEGCTLQKYHYGPCLQP